MSKSTTSKSSKTTDQRGRFEEAARKLDVDIDEERLKDALRKIAPEKPKEQKNDKD